MCCVVALGEGPSKELRDSGYFWATAVATAVPEREGEEPITVTGTIGSNLGGEGRWGVVVG
jgi:hypothetical protein